MFGTSNNTSLGRMTLRTSGRALMMMILAGAGAAVLSVSQAADSSAVDVVDYQAMGWASACVTCHGAADAVKGSSVASLAGTPADQLLVKMKAFAAGDVPGSLMQQIARGYDDETLMRIAQWYEKQGKEAQ